MFEYSKRICIEIEWNKAQIIPNLSLVFIYRHAVKGRSTKNAVLWNK